MSTDLDLFVIYRWSVAIVCSVYAVVVMGHSLWNWLSYFGRSRRTTVLGHYVAVLLLRLRVRRHLWELGQIVVLAGVFAWVVYLHHALAVAR